ncbi:tyrosinase family oxidase copper chaperone [Streptomyces sp. NRRL B-1347]|uniref:tyrosinase family oxidase copper chaperone n=1 Tax=Streptomyces sp. NRRL B-1347 TaxID=1476877 RepID=UPI00068BE61B|nr:tyrosinase family oxidase copper chaperone [Streptomyces sp. NRRL B-1347]
MTAAPGTPLIHRLGRRHLLGAAAAATLAAVGVMRAGWARATPPGAPDEGSFDEMYRGRRIQGDPVLGERGAGPSEWRVTVDGRQLGLMRRADGSYLTMVDHYGSYESPLAAARGAVDELGVTARLSGHTH